MQLPGRQEEHRAVAHVEMLEIQHVRALRPRHPQDVIVGMAVREAARDLRLALQPGQVEIERPFAREICRFERGEVCCRSCAAVLGIGRPGHVCIGSGWSAVVPSGQKLYHSWLIDIDIYYYLWNTLSRY